MDKDLNQYNQELIDKILINTEANQTFAEEEFFNFSADLFGEAGVLDDIEYQPFKNSRRGMRIDGCSYNVLEKSINVIVVKFENDYEPKVITQTELDKLSKSAYRYLEKIDDLSFLETLDETDPGRVVAESLENFIEDSIKFRIVLVTNNFLSKRIKKISIDSIKEKDTSVEIWDLQALKKIEESSSESEPFTVDFKNLCGGLKALPASFDNNSEVDSYLCVMPAQVLSDLYHEYGQRLLESNVRTFLDFRSGVNKGIRRSLVKEPQNVFAYNNGLTVTASSIKTKNSNGQLLIEELENMQIVNGGQTTSSIYFAKREKGSIGDLNYADIELDKISVQMKLNVIEDTDIAEDMKSKISEYANTQNNIQAADLVSNHPFHKKLEDLSRRIQMPAGETGIPSKWFYERTRGQYNVKMRGYSLAKKKQFQVEYPSKQKFVKTDMAKFENTWRLKPWEVKKGAQANLKLLGQVISKEFEKNEDNFKEPFYKDLIAKAILFKNSDSAILRSEWYKDNPGLKAEIVTYAIAFVRHKLLEDKKDINLDIIYANQKLTDSLLNQIVCIAKYIKEKITDSSFAETSNPSEFCKKQDAWEKIKELNYTLSDIKSIDFINHEQISERIKDNKEEIKAGDQIADYEKALKIGQDEWEALADYFIKKGFSETDIEVSLAVLCSQMFQGRRIPSEKQMKKALEIRNKALQEDFIF